jgi:hypothetical protein
MNMLIAGFFAIACYNSLELLISLFSRFRRHRGLYFWSMLIATLGIVLHSIVVLLRYHGLGPNFALAVLTCLGWYSMVTGQSVVLYSRLHLVVPYKEKTRWVLTMIIVNFFILHIPVTILFLGSNSRESGSFIKAFQIYERIQLAGFCIQESAISGFYIWEAMQGLNWVFAVKGPKERRIIRQLIVVNVLAILLDASLLATQYTDNFQIQTTYKPVVYSIKLKMEFIILNRLVRLLQRPGCTCEMYTKRPGGNTTPTSHQAILPPSSMSGRGPLARPQTNEVELPTISERQRNFSVSSEPLPVRLNR